MTGNPLDAWSYTGGERVGKVTNIPERLWLEKRWDRGGGEGPIKGSMLSDESDIIPGHVPVQGTQMRS